MHNLILRIMRKVLRRDPRSHILTCIQQGDVCAEVGVWKGEFSKKILKRRPKRLHLIDPWLYLPEFGDRCYGDRKENDQKRLDCIYQNVKTEFDIHENVTIHRQESHKVVSEFSDEYFDFIYIDGNHNYQFVKRDIESYLPKIRKGGFVAGDDYIFNRCVNGGPKRAVEEIVRSERAAIVSIKNNQYILRKL